MSLPFDGAITEFYENDAPKDVRKAIERADKNDILSDTYPYRERMGKSKYEDAMEALQLELVKLQMFNRRAGDNQPVKLLILHVLKRPVKRVHVVGSGVFGLMLAHPDQGKIDL